MMRNRRIKSIGLGVASLGIFLLSAVAALGQARADETVTRPVD